MSITATNQFSDVAKKLGKTENQLNEYLEDLSLLREYEIHTNGREYTDSEVKKWMASWGSKNELASPLEA